jgi:hypothetical protein
VLQPLDGSARRTRLPLRLIDTPHNGRRQCDWMNLEKQVRSLPLLQPRNNDYGGSSIQRDILGLGIGRGRLPRRRPQGTSVRHGARAGHRGLAHGRGLRGSAQPSRSRAIFGSHRTSHGAGCLAGAGGALHDRDRGALTSAAPCGITPQPTGQVIFTAFVESPVNFNTSHSHSDDQTTVMSNSRAT